MGNCYKFRGLTKKIKSALSDGETRHYEEVEIYKFNHDNNFRKLTLC